jgi:hypothetical protein
MKTRFLLFLLLVIGFAPLAHAQYPVSVVADPIAVENEVQQIAKWTESIGVLNQQLQQLQQTLQVALTVKGYIGDPAAAAQAMGLQLLGPQLSQSVGQLTSSLNQTVSGAMALENSGSQLFSPIDLKTPSGFSMNFDSSQFKPFAAIQSQNTNVTNVVQDTVSRIAGLQQQKATTLAQIQSAPDQSTVQKQAADHELNVSLQNFMQWEGQVSSDRTEFK